MSSATMATRMIEAAELLLRDGSASSAFRRRAVSTAYYAVFHALARQCADFPRSAPRRSEEYERVYRALEHGPLKQAFLQSPLKDNRLLSKIGQSVVRLQAERFKADYMPPITGLFSSAQAEELVGLGRETVKEIEALRAGPDNARLLATALMFTGKRR